MSPKPSLKKESLRRLKVAKFPFTCALCGERYPAGEAVYWKREAVGPNEFKTTTVCTGCIKTI